MDLSHLIAVARGKAPADLVFTHARIVNTFTEGIEGAERATRELGCTVSSPYSVLSFLAFPVIPELKLTDKGLVDVMAGRLLAASPERAG